MKSAKEVKAGVRESVESDIEVDGKKEGDDLCFPPVWMCSCVCVR